MIANAIASPQPVPQIPNVRGCGGSWWLAWLPLKRNRRWIDLDERCSCSCLCWCWRCWWLACAPLTQSTVNPPSLKCAGTLGGLKIYLVFNKQTPALHNFKLAWLCWLFNTSELSAGLPCQANSFLLCYTDYKLNYKCSPNPFCSTYMSESCLSYFILKLFCIEMSWTKNAPKIILHIHQNTLVFLSPIID